MQNLIYKLTGVSTIDSSATPGTIMLPGVDHEGAKDFLTRLWG